jgi:kinesin family member 1
MDTDKPAAIRLSGNILAEHCFFENNEGKVTINALPESVTVGFCSVTMLSNL